MPPKKLERERKESEKSTNNDHKIALNFPSLSALLFNSVRK